MYYDGDGMPACRISQRRLTAVFSSEPPDHLSLQTTEGALEGFRTGKGQALLLALHKRCWTAACRHRHGLQQDPTCVLCTSDAEEIDHILLSCTFSRQVWSMALGILGLEQMLATAGNCFWSWWLTSRKRISKDARRRFDSLTFLVGWHLWKERNSRTLDGYGSTTDEVFRAIVEEARQWSLAGFKQLGCLLPLALANGSQQMFYVN